MFKNIFHQKVVDTIQKDIEAGVFPQSALFSGAAKCAKLTIALEVARVRSCKENGADDCHCDECTRARLMASTNVLLLGHKDCTGEIAASLASFRQSGASEDKMLFLRSIRKLTSRFSPAVYSESKDLSKITNLCLEIDDAVRVLETDESSENEMQKACSKILPLCADLNGYIPRATPIDHIRAITPFARTKSATKKTVIIESAEKMSDGARNALLKILEEPPSDCSFILTTRNKQAIIATVLSRVRVYGFSTRNADEDKDIIDIVFNRLYEGSINDYLLTYSTIPLEAIKRGAAKYWDAVTKGGAMLATIELVLKDCGNLGDDELLKIFYRELMRKTLDLGAAGIPIVAIQSIYKMVQKAYGNMTTYNQNARSALEGLAMEVNTQLLGFQSI